MWYNIAKIERGIKIDRSQQTAYYIIAQTIVKNALKNPSSAKFPSVITNAGEVAMERNGALVVVQSYVDATNSFGAKIRTNWTVEFMVYDLDSFSYETVYINLGGEKAGEYIEMDEWTQ